MSLWQPGKYFSMNHSWRIPAYGIQPPAHNAVAVDSFGPIGTQSTFTGDSGNNTINGTSGADFFNMNDGGNDTVNGLAGADIFTFGATLTSADKVNGGADYDVLILSGNYAAGVTFSATTMTGVEEIDLLGSTNSYKLTLNDANVASGQTFVVSASSMDSSHTLNWDSSADTDARFTITSGSGGDTIKVRSLGNIINTGAGADTVTVTGTNAGSDTINTGAGADTINMGSVLDASDKIDGGSEFDTIVLNGDYNVALNATTIANIEKIQLTAGHDYSFGTVDANIAAGQSLFVDASLLGSANHLAFNGSAETNGWFHLEGGASNDTFSGSANADLIRGNDGNDTILPGAGTGDIVDAGAGNDTVFAAANLDAADQLDGGTGSDTLNLNGDYSAGLVFGANTAQNFEFLTLTGGMNYTLTTNDATVAAGQSLFITDQSETAANTITFDGSAEADGKFSFSLTGAETLHLKGGAGGDDFSISAPVTAADTFDGLGGFNLLTFLAGQSSGPVALSFQNIAALAFEGSSSYDVTIADGNIATGQTMIIDDNSSLTAINTLIVDDSAETDAQTTFLITGTETKSLIAGAGNDLFQFTDNLKVGDHIDGGAGSDLLTLNGSYSLTLGATTLDNVEFVNFVSAGHNYNIVANDATVAAGQTMTISSTVLQAGDVASWDGSSETDGSYVFSGANGSDHFSGGSGNDTFKTGAGTDILKGNDGDDAFTFNAGDLTSADNVDGGTGIDTVKLSGDYSAGLVMTATTLVNMELIQLDPSFSYNLTTSDGTVTVGQTLAVDGQLFGSNTLVFNGSAELDGHFSIAGGNGNDTLTGGQQGDTFTPGSGTDTVHGMGGDDEVIFSAAGFDATDTVDGGNGVDTVRFTSDGSYVIGAGQLVNVEKILLAASHDYTLTVADGVLAAGQTLTIDGSQNAGGDLFFDGSAETEGQFVILGANGGDSLTGGAGDDQINGGGGDNIIYGGDGDDLVTATNGLDTVHGGEGDDTIHGGTAVSSLDGDGGDDIITTNNTGGGSTLSGDDGNDTITGNVGSDTLIGGTGDDHIEGAGGNDTITGGDGDDYIDLTASGVYTVTGGNDNDTIYGGNTLQVASAIDGGAGVDTLILDGGFYNTGFTFGANTIHDIEIVSVAAGHSYNLTTNNANVAAGETLTVDGWALGAANSLTFNGAAESDGNFSITGGAGNDTLTGGSQADSFDLTLGGTDIVSGGGGADTFDFGANFSAADSVDGGASSDVVKLAGNYAAGVVFTDTTMRNVEKIVVGSGFNYKLVTADATVGAAKVLTLDGSALGAADHLTFDGSAELDGSFKLTGGAGDDVLTGGAGADSLDVSLGGKDAVQGGGGDDTITLGASLLPNDKIDGGGGNDTVVLSGDYASVPLGFNTATMVNVETLSLKDGFNYNLHTADATVAAGQTLTVDGSHLGAASSLVFRGNGESDGHFVLLGGGAADNLMGGSQSDTISGGNGDDTIDITLGGNDTVTAGGGIDTVVAGAAFNALDNIDGGGGATDTLMLNGDYSAGVVFTATTLTGIGTLRVTGGHSYSFTSNDTTVAAGRTMTVNGLDLGANDHLTFDGSAESNGAFILNGGAGSDTLSGGAGIDKIRGGLGADHLTGNGGADVFIYKAAAESTGAGYDTITGFDFASDQIDTTKTIKAIDAAQSGALSSATLDAQLTSTFDAAHLARYDAALFNATSGTLAGHTFLVIDTNGTAGYQAGADYVIDVSGATHTASFSTGDFV